MILRIPTRVVNEMKEELHRRENMPPDLYAELEAIRSTYRPKPDPKSLALFNAVGVMYALLSSEVQALKLEVKHGKANFPGQGWKPVLIADTEEELKAEIRRREWRPEALRHKVTEAITTLTD